tara:strand:+ start:24609 stop:24713 length:105 start_codon:yes stop_codon:yes gene_type:complete
MTAPSGARVAVEYEYERERRFAEHEYDGLPSPTY